MQCSVDESKDRVCPFIFTDPAVPSAVPEMPSVFIKTYGCQMNERDSEAVAAQLMAKGYAVAPDEAQADVILLNTCSVRDAAEQKAINKMETLIGQTRKRNPDTVLGLSLIHI